MIAPKYEHYLFGFLMSIKMSIIMSGVITYINLGLANHFAALWFNAWWRAFIVAFPTILLVGPVVRRSVRLLLIKE